MEKNSSKKKLKLSIINIRNVVIEKTERINDIKELNEGMFLLSLFDLLNEKDFEYENKIKKLSILSMFAHSQKDMNYLMNLVNQLKKLIKSHNRLEKESLIKIFYRMGNLLKDLNHSLFSYYYLYQSKGLTDSENGLMNNESCELLEKAFNQSLSQLLEFTHRYHNDYLNNKEQMVKECETFNKIYNEVIKPASLCNSEQKIYLINARWLENLQEFAVMYKEKNNDELKDFLNNSFELKKLLSNYLRGDKINSNGSFPGEINNFDITEFADMWIDPDKAHLHENVLLEKNLEENKDYYYISESNWNYLSEKFGATNEISRCQYDKNDNSNNENDKQVKYEINLGQLNVFIIEKSLKKDKKSNLKEKKIQFSNEINIKQFKDKMARCLGIKDVSLEFRLYSTESLNKEDLLILLIAYTSNCDKFQISLEEIKLNDDDSVTKLTELNLPFILIEVYETNEIPFIISPIDNCSHCNTTIDSNSWVRCSQCSYNYYCSEKCLLDDPYHKYIHDWPYWVLELKKLQQLNLLSFADKAGNKGRTGLINVGNTCFMASGIQCLSNTEDLTKYFLSGLYKQEINTFSHFGSKGTISSKYNEILDIMWNKNISSLNTNIFRIPLCKKTGYFRDNSQQDSHEFISLVLDNLHEDLNRINKKPYFDMIEQKSDETDTEASYRYWQCHKKRDDSIIVDLFHGQLKATIICPGCNKINITYDPFMFLSLSIPNEVTMLKYKLFTLENLCKENAMVFFNDSIILHLKRNVATYFPKISVDCIEVLVINKDKTIREIPNDNTKLQILLENDSEILCYEKQSKDTNLLYVYPITSEIISYFFSKSTFITYISYPFAFPVSQDTNLRKIWVMVYNEIKRIIKLQQTDLIDIAIVENWTLPKIFPFSLRISHYCFRKENNICQFCSDNSVPFCDAFSSMTFDSKYNELIQNMYPNSKIVFFAQIPKNIPLKKLFNNVEMPLNSSPSPSLMSSKNNFNITDCLNLFNSEEKLTPDNAWYCNICKKHKEAWKKIEIYQPPNYLIVHFKRFKIKSNNAVLGFFNNKKNNVYIDYPIENLNLSDYVIGPNAKNARYELYGVVNHSGGLNQGHYYAYCKNQSQWLFFDDEKLGEINEKEVVNSNAYLLFYKKKILEDY